MSLLDIAKGLKKNGFDPRKDSVNGQPAIPAGTYPVVLKKRNSTFQIVAGKVSVINLKSAVVITMDVQILSLSEHLILGKQKMEKQSI